MDRRKFIKIAGISGTILTPSLYSSLDYIMGVGIFPNSRSKDIKVHNWKRDERNPIFPPNGGWFDQNRTMNPFVLTHEGKYLLFYSGADEKVNQRICLATASIDNIYEWNRLGPIIDIGKDGFFDDDWCVLPCVHKINGKWHLYYTGKAKKGDGLQAFGGIGLATSDDLFNWKKYSSHPVLRGDGFQQWPNNKGIAGGGSIISIPQNDGRVLYRMHFTLTTGSPSKDLLVDQAKQSVVAHSYDGIHWVDKRVVLQPRLEADYENAGVTGFKVWKTKKQWRAIYPAIGTKFGAYAICEAVSKDGLNWERGMPGDNLSMAPGSASWENEMVEYPHIVRQGNKLRMFYCGNGYGKTGIGMATAKMIR